MLKRNRILILSITLLVIICSGIVIRRKAAVKKITIKREVVSNEDKPLVEEYKKLLDLRFDNYEDMTVSDYRDKAKQVIATDEVSYHELLDRDDSKLNQSRFTDKNAWFIMNTLAPLVAEGWRQWDYQNYVTNRDNDFYIEYVIRQTIVDAQVLKVKDIEKALTDLIAFMQTFMDNKTKKELEETETIKTLLQSEIDSQADKFNRDIFTFKVSSFYYSGEPFDVGERQISLDSQLSSTGLSEDDQLLLSLRTRDYQKLTVRDFNQQIQQKINADDKMYSQAFEKVYDELLTGSELPYNAAELYFLELTLGAATAENSAKQTERLTKEATNPYLDRYSSQYVNCIVNKKRVPTVSFSTEYRLEYKIVDESKLLVSERDLFLANIINDIQAYIDSKTPKELLKSQRVFEKELAGLIAKSSNKEIVFEKVEIYYYDGQ